MSRWLYCLLNGILLKEQLLSERLTSARRSRWLSANLHSGFNDSCAILMLEQTPPLCSKDVIGRMFKMFPKGSNSDHQKRANGKSCDLFWSPERAEAGERPCPARFRSPVGQPKTWVQKTKHVRRNTPPAWKMESITCAG